MGVLRASTTVLLCSMLDNFVQRGSAKRKNRFPGVHQEYQRGKCAFKAQKRTDRQIGFCSQTAKEVGGDNTAWFLVDEVKRQVGSANERTMEESTSKETEREEFFFRSSEGRKEGNKRGSQ